MSEIVGAIPEHWESVRLGDIATVLRGASPRPKGNPLYFGGDIPWISIRDVTKEPGRYLTTTREGLTPEGAKKSRYLSKGTLILSNSGTVCVPKILAMDGCIHDGFVSFPDLPNQVHRLFLYEYFNLIRPFVVNKHRQGITQVNLNTGIVGDFQIPIPPLPEQHRIVAAIESYLTRLDDAVASLERVQKNLKRYRASVLKAAVEGRLVPTEAELARKEGREYEPAGVLLDRILKERRRRWEEDELARMKAKGEEPKNDKWKEKYKEPVAPDTSGLPDLPEGWVWTTTDALFCFVTSGSRGWAKYYSEDGAVFLRMGNLDHDTVALDLADIQNVNPPAGQEGTRTRVQVGDILVSITADVGMIGLYDRDLGETYINQHVALARPSLSELGRYVAWYLCSRDGGQKQFNLLRRGATKVGLGLDDIRNVAVPLPPVAEQLRLVGQVEELLSLADAQEGSLAVQVRGIGRLRQSILKWAFEGKLVDQDPTDEPASVLLERIKAERATLEAQKKANKKKTSRRKK